MLMVGSMRKIEFDDLTEALPAFACIALMVFTYNIANGLTAGLVLYPIGKIVAGRARELNWGQRRAGAPMPHVLPVRLAALTPGLPSTSLRPGKTRGSTCRAATGPLRALVVVLGVFASACSGPAPGREAPPAAPPDVVLITVDTLRADRVGGALTPTINAVGARGARFLAARTTAPLTLPAHVSLMTGAIPPVTGVRLNGAHRFDDARPTLATLLKGAGRETAAFIGAFVLDRQFGLATGFDTYDDQIARAPGAPLKLEAERPASAVADRAIAWVRKRQQAGASGRRPYFLWAHVYDPHAPYTPPPDALARAGGAAYDGEVAYADAEIGRLLRAVSDAGAGRPTLIVILGDHGESLGEHGERTHGMLLYDGALRIPLVIAGPGVPEAEHRRPVSIVDVAPTVLRLAGLAVPGEMQGRDLFSGPGDAHEVYAETLYPRTLGWSALTALVEDRWKVIAPDGGGEELYDIASDPAERENTAGRRPEVVQAAVVEACRHHARRGVARISHGERRGAGAAPGARLRRQRAASDARRRRRRQSGRANRHLGRVRGGARTAQRRFCG